MGLEMAGGYRCVFSSDSDPYARRTYQSWFGEEPKGDILNIKSEDIPDHYLLTAGFPCQPFSVGGVSSNTSLGKQHGFNHPSGNLFFEILRVAKEKNTPMLLLENVKNLVYHDGGESWRVMLRALKEMGYYVNFQIINASLYVPQNRKRVFILATKKPNKFDKFVPHPGFRKDLDEILEDCVDSKYHLSDTYWYSSYCKKQRDVARSSGFCYKIIKPGVDLISGTLPAGYKREILIDQYDYNPRRLTPRECARLMGFSDDYPIVVSDKRAYSQFGSAVCPLIIEDIAHFIREEFY